MNTDELIDKLNSMRDRVARRIPLDTEDLAVMIDVLKLLLLEAARPKTGVFTTSGELRYTPISDGDKP